VLASVPAQAQDTVANVAGQGVLAGLNLVLVLGALLSFAGALLALWLVREDEIDREPVESEPERRREPEAVPEAVAA
jgi:hypothetical protein